MCAQSGVAKGSTAQIEIHLRFLQKFSQNLLRVILADGKHLHQLNLQWCLCLLREVSVVLVVNICPHKVGTHNKCET